MKRAILFALVCSFALGVTAPDVQARQSRIFNTVKAKLAAGERVVGGTVSTADPDIYCAMANSGFDFMWIEMQHSPLTYTDVARMIWACRGAPAIPFIRVPNATEGDIQKATDIGALGIIVPMVDDADKIRNAVTFAKFPPMGKRSQGGGQYRALWGNDYRRTANDNIMIIAMIESPAGVANAAEIAGVPGVDVVFAASSDLGSFSGKRQGDPEYEALVTAIEAGTLGADRLLGGPLAWMSTRAPYRFFQGPGTTSLIRRGASVVLEAATPCRELPAGVAPIEGEERCR
jgi:4-hydroxy-2-oxoheptanedioate aldolase